MEQRSDLAFRLLEVLDMMKALRLVAPITLLAAGTAAAQEVDSEVPPPAPAPAPVVAAPGQMAPAQPLAQPAPQNENWNDVSHINGTVVPVGQRGDYLYKFKKTNIASNPIGWIVGFYGISVSTAVSENIVLRGDVNLISIHDSTESGYEVGASVPIYFRRAYSGPFIEPGLIVRNVYDHSQDDIAFGGGTTTDHPASVGPSVVFGWHWTFDSGLNVAAAFGLMRNLAHQDTMDFGDSDIEPSGYFRVGYAF